MSVEDVKIPFDMPIFKDLFFHFVITQDSLEVEAFGIAWPAFTQSFLLRNKLGTV